MSYKRPESVLVVVLNDKAVLCLERTDSPGFWQSVTGSLEADESPLAAAGRELFEETGLSLGAGQLIDAKQTYVYDIYPQWRHRYEPHVSQNREHCFYFIVDATMGSDLKVQLSREHQRYQWLPWDDAMQLMSSPSNQQAIKQWYEPISVSQE